MLIRVGYVWIIFSALPSYANTRIRSVLFRFRDFKSLQSKQTLKVTLNSAGGFAPIATVTDKRKTMPTHTHTHRAQGQALAISMHNIDIEHRQFGQRECSDAHQLAAVRPPCGSGCGGVRWAIDYQTKDTSGNPIRTNTCDHMCVYKNVRMAQGHPVKSTQKTST